MRIIEELVEIGPNEVYDSKKTFQTIPNMS